MTESETRNPAAAAVFLSGEGTRITKGKRNFALNVYIYTE